MATQEAAIFLAAAPLSQLPKTRKSTGPAANALSWVTRVLEHLVTRLTMKYLLQCYLLISLTLSGATLAGSAEQYAQQRMALMRITSWTNYLFFTS